MVMAAGLLSCQKQVGILHISCLSHDMLFRGSEKRKKKKSSQRLVDILSQVNHKGLHHG